MKKQKTQDHIIEAADQLFYQQGYEHTSFADIADAVQISRGNFYYHFKTKDDILEAVIKARMDKTGAMLALWQQNGSSPQDRIKCFIRILITNRDKILNYGCPVGTLTTELAKLNHASRPEANALFSLFRVWLKDQFVQMGCEDEEADDQAMHLLARSQGVATLASAFHDAKFIGQEVTQMCKWVEDYMPA